MRSGSCGTRTRGHADVRPSPLFAGILAFAATLSTAAQAPAPPVDGFTGHPRVIVISDIGNEPDDQMSLVRLLVYSNELDIEGLIAATSTWQKTVTHPETMHALIDAYGESRPNLMLNAKGWPTAQQLNAAVFGGQPAYGMAAVGAGLSSAGSEAIVRAVDRDDPRPVWICLWGGANTLAQALRDVRASRSEAEVAKFIAKIRVSSISDQDDAGPWIRKEFPALMYVVEPSAPNGENYYYATWTGISGDQYYRSGDGADASEITNEWLQTNIRNKGPLGAHYPRFAFIMEGDTPSFLGLIDNGLNAYRRPDWGGWGGRYVYRQPYGETHPIWTQGGDLFSRVTSQDSVMGIDGKLHVSDQATIWRWRDAFQNDFAARMTWTIADYQHSNHNPVVVVNDVQGTQPIMIDATVGEEIVLDARKSVDPDGQPLRFHWMLYAEAGGTGTSLAAVELQDVDAPRATVKATATCRPMWLPMPEGCPAEGVAHLILAVTDDGSPNLTSYRRVILSVHAEKP